MMKMNKANLWTKRSALCFVSASAMALSVLAAPNLPVLFAANAAPATACTLAGDDNVQQRTEEEVLNSFPGGMDGLIKFLQQHVQYPKACTQNGFQGIALVHFAVDQKGRIGKVKGEYKPIGKDKDKTFSKEEMKLQKKLIKEGERVVKLMPRLKPAVKNGTPVDCQLTLPVLFRMR